MKRVLLAVGLAVALAAGPVASAEDKAETPRKLLDEAGEKFLRAIELMLMAIPQYEAPEILDNGDIIIRRKRPDAPKKADPPPAPPPPPRDGTDRT